MINEGCYKWQNVAKICKYLQQVTVLKFHGQNRGNPFFLHPSIVALILEWVEMIEFGVPVLGMLFSIKCDNEEQHFTILC